MDQLYLANADYIELCNAWPNPHPTHLTPKASHDLCIAPYHRDTVQRIGSTCIYTEWAKKSYTPFQLRQYKAI